MKYDIFGPRPHDGPYQKREPAEPETTEDLLRKIYGLHFRVGLFFVITWTVFVLPLCVWAMVSIWQMAATFEQLNARSMHH